MEGFIIAAQVIFAFYNAINDPIIGFITEKPHKFTKKYGIRFPWLATTIIPLFNYWNQNFY